MDVQRAKALLDEVMCTSLHSEFQVTNRAIGAR